MKKETYYMVECDPDWGQRWARDRKFQVVMRGPLSPKTLKKRLEVAAEINEDAKRMCDYGKLFNEFTNPFEITEIKIL